MRWRTSCWKFSFGEPEKEFNFNNSIKVAFSIHDSHFLLFVLRRNFVETMAHYIQDNPNRHSDLTENRKK